MPVSPADPAAISGALRDYLSALLATEVRFAEPPAALGRGFDTYIYSFRLDPAGHGPAWERSLVLRIYPTPEQAGKARREAAVQRFTAARGFPALDPLAIEPCAEPFGLPIMIMPRVEGRTMLDIASRNPLRFPGLLSRMAGTQAALHRLPVDGCPLPYDGPLVERQLAELRDQIARAGLREFEQSIAWLEENKAAVMEEERALTHNDFHPLNLMVDGAGAITVLDWSDAQLGDRHHDVGRSVLLFWIAPIAAASAVERVALRLGRGFLMSRYLNAYRRELPLDVRRLHYWQAYHACQGRALVEEIRKPQAAASGAVRPESLDRVPLDLADGLRRYFNRLTGT